MAPKISENLQEVSLFKAVADEYAVGRTYDDQGNIRRKGTSALADEIIPYFGKFRRYKIKVPLKTRDELAQEGTHLPSAELLSAIHYYMSYYSYKNPKTMKSRNGQRHKTRKIRKYMYMDESALLAMGYIIESYVDEYIKGEVFKLYMEKRGEESGN